MKVKVDIINYIEKNILPQYGDFDKAHNLNHINRVIENSLEIARSYPVDINLIYVIAAYHDIGMPKGRKDHGNHSAEILLEDRNLDKWFSGDERTLMAEAIEDHRASLGHEPRSIYGKIVADADNDLEYRSILMRCLWHSLAHFPGHDKDTHFDRIFNHMIDKYGENGYLKTWLNSEHDMRSLSEIRHKLTNDRKGLRADFDELWNLEVQT